MPDRGTSTKIRRVPIPSSPSNPVATGFRPWKSNISQPSRSASARASCMAERVVSFNILGLSLRVASPFRSPLADSFSALSTMNVLYLRSHIIEKPEQLAKRCLVEKAASRFWCAVHGDRAGDLERKKRAGSLEAPIEKIFGERADLLHRHRAAHESGHAPDRLPPRWRDRLVDIAGQDETRIPEEVLSVGPPPDERAKALGFSEWNALPAFQRFVVAPNLRINRVAKAESLVPELGNIFSFGRVARRIDSTNCFQKAERYPRVDRRRHIQEKGESASDGRRGAKKHNSLVKDLRLLTRGGVVAAAILGAVSLLAGPGWAILLIAFFISGAFLSHVGEARKLARTGGI